MQNGRPQAGGPGAGSTSAIGSYVYLRESPLLRALAAGMTAAAILVSAALVSSFIPVRIARD